MKKLLLTLGTAASVVAPIATVVACGDSESGPVTLPGTVSVSNGTLTLSGFLGPRITGEKDKEVLTSWMIEMGDKLLVENQEQVLKVVLEGDMDLEENGDLGRIEKTIDLAKNNFANLKEAYNYYDAEYTGGEEFTVAGSLFAALTSSAFDNNLSGGDGDSSSAPTEVLAVMTSIEALTVTSTKTELESSSFTHGVHVVSDTGTVDSLGLEDTEFKKVTDILGTDFDLEEVSWDSISPATIDITFTQVSDPSDTMWEASIGTIVWEQISDEAIAANDIATELKKYAVGDDTIDAPTASLGPFSTPSDLEDNFGISRTLYDAYIAAIETDGAGGDSGFKFDDVEHDFANNDQLTITFTHVSTNREYTAVVDVNWKY